MRTIRNSKTLFAVGALFLLAGSVWGYALLNPKRTWRNGDIPVSYIVDDRGLSSVSDGDGGVAATVSAVNSAAAWNGAGSGTLVAAVAGSVASWQLGDGVPMLNFDDPENVCTGNCLAATFTGFYSRQGRNVFINDADIVTNTAYNWTSESEDPGGAGCSSEFYIEGVQVHELGHGLGLGHSNVSGSTMFPSVSSCNNAPATIEQDDKDGINELYGGGGGGSCTLKQKGEACTANDQCCSGKCRGPAGGQTCK